MKAGLIWRTVRHLKARQVLFQGLNRLRCRLRLRLPGTVPTGYFLDVPAADKPVSWVDDTFTFLNQSVTFPDGIDWNHTAPGKLWTYNLNYFDFLNQPNLPVETGLGLMRHFVEQADRLRDGLEPYPTSLRIVNWVQFLSRHRIQDVNLTAHLYAQTALLSRRLEYHLAGNHLLENGFALLTAALFFRHQRWLHRATRLVRTELETQVLTDGGHDERSPMYHAILLDRLLDVLIALQTDTWASDAGLVAFLTEKSRQMLDWLNSITFANGDVPMVNDAACGIAPTTALLRMKVGVPDHQETSHLINSGYRMVRQPRYELFADVGAVGPDYQPGHAHADTLSFVLYVDGRPLIVDAGTSTYQPGPRRAWERSTAAHNTVEIGGQNSSEVWGGFRVGRRARVTVRTDTEAKLSARHAGYAFLGVTHARTWQFTPNQIIITDQLTGPGVHDWQAIARFYFHPDVVLSRHETNVMAGPVRLTVTSVSDWTATLEAVQIADGFNRLKDAQCLAIRFMAQLQTTLTFFE